jgi:hypothetical protein
MMGIFLDRRTGFAGMGLRLPIYAHFFLLPFSF